MRQEHQVDNAVDQSLLPLFTAEFAKRQYISLYRVIDAQGDQPQFICPEILLYVKETMEALRLNDDDSILRFWHGLDLCQQNAEMAKDKESKSEQCRMIVFRASLDAVKKSITVFLEKKYPALAEKKKIETSHYQRIELPTFTNEMQKKISREIYIKSDLPSAKLV